MIRLQSCVKYLETLSLFSIKCTCTEALRDRINHVSKFKDSEIFHLLPTPLQAIFGPIGSPMFCNAITSQRCIKGVGSAIPWKLSHYFCTYQAITTKNSPHAHSNNSEELISLQLWKFKIKESFKICLKSDALMTLNSNIWKTLNTAWSNDNVTWLWY